MGQGPDKERRHKLAGSPARGEHYDDNIITWEGAEPGPAPRPHKLAPPAGMGAQTQSVPYGTQLDLNAPPQASWATGSRKARVGSRAATGMWFNPVAPMPPSDEQMRASKRMQANNPNNLDHIGKGFAVPAEMFHSGKKQFGGSGSTGGVDHFYVCVSEALRLGLLCRHKAVGAPTHRNRAVPCALCRYRRQCRALATSGECSPSRSTRTTVCLCNEWPMDSAQRAASLWLRPATCANALSQLAGYMGGHPGPVTSPKAKYELPCA